MKPLAIYYRTCKPLRKYKEGLSNLFHLSNNIPTMKDVQPEFTKFIVSPT